MSYRHQNEIKICLNGNHRPNWPQMPPLTKTPEDLAMSTQLLVKQMVCLKIVYSKFSITWEINWKITL